MVVASGDHHDHLRYWQWGAKVAPLDGIAIKPLLAPCVVTNGENGTSNPNLNPKPNPYSNPHPDLIPNSSLSGLIVITIVANVDQW